MLFLDFKAYFLFGMMLGDMWKNSTNWAFSLPELKKTSLLFYNGYYSSKVN